MSILMVQEFAKKFDLPAEDKPQFACDSDIKFRVDRLYEEVGESHDAHALDDFVGFFDALLDLAYVTYGTALRVGITPEQWEQGFAAVHKANMAKIKVTDVDDSRFKNVNDIIKPKGWTGPEQELRKIIYG